MPITQAPSSPQRKTSKTSHPGGSSAPHASLTPRDETRKDNLMGVMSAASMLALMRGNYADAGAVSAHGPKVAKELVLLGKTNEPVGKVLDMLAQAGPYTGIIFATLPLLAQLAVNHGRIEASKVSGIPGVKPKDVLEKQVKAELAEEEMRQHQEIKAMEESIAAVQKLEEEENATS
jgi:hypothetical protein